MNIFYCQCYNRYKNGIFLSYNSDMIFLCTRICRDSSDLDTWAPFKYVKYLHKIA